jgi:hypothetical protein
MGYLLGVSHHCSSQSACRAQAPVRMFKEGASLLYQFADKGGCVFWGLFRTGHCISTKSLFSAASMGKKQFTTRVAETMGGKAGPWDDEHAFSVLSLTDHLIISLLTASGKSLGSTRELNLQLETCPTIVSSNRLADWDFETVVFGNSLNKI